MSNMRRSQSKPGAHNISVGLLLTLLGCCWSNAVVSSTVSAAQSTQLAQPKPAPAPARWRGLIGEYGSDKDILIILEKDGRLFALFKRVEFEPLTEVSSNVFNFPAPGAHAGQHLIFSRD